LLCGYRQLLSILQVDPNSHFLTDLLTRSAGIAGSNNESAPEKHDFFHGTPLWSQPNKSAPNAAIQSNEHGQEPRQFPAAGTSNHEQRSKIYRGAENRNT
jgi:hypothetical protein